MVPTPQQLDTKIMMATAPRYFLDLPQEIRLDVYDYLLQPDYIDLETEGNPTLVGLSNEDIARTRVYHTYFSRGTQALHPQVLRTCSQIYDEAVATLYKPRKLEIVPSDTRMKPAGYPPLHKFCTARLRDILILPTLEITVLTTAHTLAEDALHSAFFTAILRPGAVVKKLILHIGDGWSEYDEPEEAERHFAGLTQMVKDWGKSGFGAFIRLRLISLCTNEQIEWHKIKGEQWREAPESHVGGSYCNTGRPDRLFEAVEDSFA
ncbi:hypothetical protein LTR56_009712 [Elasticomyces elasticus]|nr:hypothetical protein LTR22_025070 [Elasticomyces elasticus]KAK3644175.1 hypothetical protein LTR56_009712 [Elasticomyces elasticus]KAK4919132.1 hypothetical protein LTR49_013136 [Elasticomyces elasticus]KAK5741811.1 hypothetical protein LTS12_024488 [Elasticomyces elasticus]